MQQELTVITPDGARLCFRIKGNGTKEVILSERSTYNREWRSGRSVDRISRIGSGGDTNVFGWRVAEKRRGSNRSLEGGCNASAIERCLALR